MVFLTAFHTLTFGALSNVSPLLSLLSSILTNFLGRLHTVSFSMSCERHSLQASFSYLSLLSFILKRCPFTFYFIKRHCFLHVPSMIFISIPIIESQFCCFKFHLCGNSPALTLIEEDMYYIAVFFVSNKFFLK